MARVSCLLVNRNATKLMTNVMVAGTKLPKKYDASADRMGEKCWTTLAVTPVEKKLETATAKPERT